MKTALFAIFILLQVIAMSSASPVSLSYINIALNKTCGEMNATNTLTIAADIITTSKDAKITLKQTNDNFKLMNTEVTITPDKNASFNVTVATTALGDKESQLFKVEAKKLYTWKSSNGTNNLKHIYLGASNFTNNGGNLTACMDFAIAYGQKNITNLTAVDLGCWNWKPNMSTPLTYNPWPKSSVDSWAKSLEKDVCSGARSNGSVMTIFTIILAALIALINKH